MKNNIKLLWGSAGNSVFKIFALTMLVGSLFASTGSMIATAIVFPGPTTNPATGITISDATLNGTNGGSAATGHSFWVSLASFSTASPTIPAGVYSTPDLGPISAGASWSATLSSITTSGVPSNLPAITPNTTYYFVAWSLVGGTWTPGEILNFTTLGPTVTVTIDKFINGEQATAESADSSAFPMASSWSASNIGSGSGTYSLSTSGYNSSNPYEAVTSDMSSGADYATHEVTGGEVVGTSCSSGAPYALVGYTTGDSFAEASAAEPSLTSPDFTDITSDKFVIVWNKTCPPVPTHVSPADGSSVTTAELDKIDWSDVTDPAMPMSYFFEDSAGTATNPDGSFMTVIYSSGPLTVSEQPTPGTPEGVYNWHVRAVDAAGNSSDWSSPWVTTVDNSSSLTIVKVTDPVGATGIFPVDVTGPSEYGTHLDLCTGDSVNEECASSYVLEDIPAGTYNITETVPEGWDFTSMMCGEGETQSVTNGGSYDVAVGENATCTITNTKRASVTVTKYTDPVEDGPFQFTLSGGPGGQESVPATSPELGNEDSWTMDNLLPGAGYNLSEIIPGGWTGAQDIACTGGDNPEGSVGGDGFNFDLNPGDALNCVVNNTEDAAVSGRKFEDMDGSGAGTTGSGLAGWTINFYLQDNPDTPSTTETGSFVADPTNSDGNYNILLQPGTYRVCESLSGHPGWHSSYPSESVENWTSCESDGGGYVLTIAAGSNTNGIDFGNYQLGTISGTKWHDQNGNGIFDLDEPGLNGWSIQLMRNGDPIDTQVTSGGTYQFTGVHPGEYTVGEVQQEDWAQSSPANNSDHAVTAVSGGIVVNVDFGNVEDATISGMKWEDENADGLNIEEPSMGGWTIYADLNGDGSLDTGEPYDVTDTEDGSYTIAGLLPGTYTIREVPQNGWGQTYPADDGYNLVVLSINEDATDVNFGNARAITVSGMKWNDSNADGYVGEENNIAGWTIFASPITTSGEPDTESGRVEKETTTDSEGNYVFSFLPNNAGSGWWRISEEQRDGWSQTYPIFSEEREYYDVFISSEGLLNYSEQDFGNWESPTIRVFKWNDENSNGIRDGLDEEFSEDPVELWPMALGRVMESDSSSTQIEIVDTALTNSEGLADLFVPVSGLPGDYVVLEGARNNWNMTYPASRTENLIISFASGVEPISLSTGSFFDLNELDAWDNGDLIDRGYVPSQDEEDEDGQDHVDLEFGNHETPPSSDSNFRNGSGGRTNNDNEGQVLGVATSTPTGDVLGSVCELPLTAYLRRGRVNDPESVSDLQNFLNSELKLEPPIPLTGFFGPITEAAVKAFQLKYYDEVLKPWVDLGLLPANTATGIVYKMTLWKIQMLGCPDLNTPKPIIP